MSRCEGTVEGCTLNAIIHFKSRVRRVSEKGRQTLVTGIKLWGLLEPPRLSRYQHTRQLAKGLSRKEENNSRVVTVAFWLKGGGRVLG